MTTANPSLHQNLQSARPSLQKLFVSFLALALLTTSHCLFALDTLPSTETGSKLDQKQVAVLEAKLKLVLGELGYGPGLYEQAKASYEQATPNSIEREVLEQNIPKLKLIEISRSLSAKVISHALQRMQEQPGQAAQIKAQIADVTASLLKLKMQLLTDKFDAEIETIDPAQQELRKSEIAKATKLAAQETIDKMSSELIANMMTLMIGEADYLEIKKNPTSDRAKQLAEHQKAIETSVMEYLVVRLSHPEMSETMDLGKAFAFAAISESRTSTAPPLRGIEDAIEAQCKLDGIELSHYISDTIVYSDKKGKPISHHFKDGSIVMTSPGKNLREEFVASIATVQNNVWNRTGNFFRALGFRFIVDEETVMQKINTRQRLNLWDRFKFWLTQTSLARGSISESAIAKVSRIRGEVIPSGRSALANVQLLGMRATPGGMGGVCSVGIEQYLNTGRLLVVQLDAKKVAAKFLKTEYPKNATIWTSRDTSMSPDGETIKLSGRQEDLKWKTNISPEEFAVLKILAAKNPNRFLEVVISHVVSQMEKFMTTQEALGYFKGAVAGHMASSGAVPVLAFLKALGIDPQESPDLWNGYAKLAVALKTARKNPDARNIKLDERPVNPNAFKDAPLHSGVVEFDFGFGNTVEDLRLGVYSGARPVCSTLVRDHVIATRTQLSHLFNLEQIAKGLSTAMAVGQMGTVAHTSDLPRLRPQYEVADHSGTNALEVKSATPFATSDLGRTETVVIRSNEYEAFLTGWGFKDRTQAMKANLAQGEGKGYHSWINGIQLQRNIKSYDVMNTARVFSSWIMARVADRVGTQSVQDALAEFTAKLLSQKPMNPPVKMPTRFMPADGDTDKVKAEKMEAREKYLFEFQRDHIENHARTIEAMVLNLVYGKQLVQEVAQALRGNPADPQALKWKAEFTNVYTMCWHGAERLYMDDTVGRANFLGQALASLIEYEAAKEGQSTVPKLNQKISQKANTMAALKAETMRQLTQEGSDWRHFFGDKMVQMTEKGLTETTITDGTILLTQNMAQESTAISQGASARDLKRARKHGMVGSMLLMLSNPTQTDEGAHGGQSNVARLRDWWAQSPLPGLTLGYSHYVCIDFEEVIVNGVKLIRKKVIDAYPNHNADESQQLENAGGPRLSSLDQVINRTTHSRALVAFREAVAFRKAFLEEIRDRLVASEIALALREKSKKGSDGLLETAGTQKEQMKQIEKMIPEVLARNPHLNQGEKFDILELWSKIYYEDGTGGKLKLRYMEHFEVTKNGYYKDGISFYDDYDLEMPRDEFRPTPGQPDRRNSSKMTITESEFVSLHMPNGVAGAMFELQNLHEGRLTQRDQESARAWYGKTIAKVSAKKEEYIERGWIFMWVTEKRHMQGTTYCSLFEERAFQESVGFTPQFQKGGYRNYVKRVGRMIIKKSADIKAKQERGEKLNFLERFLEPKLLGAEAFIAAALLKPDTYAPTAFVINKGVLDKDIHQWNFENRTYLQRMRFSFKQFWTTQREIKAALESIHPRTETNLTRTLPVDHTEKAGLTHAATLYVHANDGAEGRGASVRQDLKDEALAKAIGEFVENTALVVAAVAAEHDESVRTPEAKAQVALADGLLGEFVRGERLSQSEAKSEGDAPYLVDLEAVKIAKRVRAQMSSRHATCASLFGFSPMH